MDNAEAATVKGWEAYSKKKYDEALQLLLPVIQSHPNSALVHFRLAFCYRMLGKADRALSHFRAAADLEPANAGYRYQIGKQRALDGNLSDALPAFADALDRDATWVLAYYDAAACVARLGYFELAVMLFTVCETLCDVGATSGYRPQVSAMQLHAAVHSLRRLLGNRYDEVVQATLKEIGYADVNENAFRIGRDGLQRTAKELAGLLRDASISSGGQESHE